ncbi:MAG: hypothetical protein R3D33_15440 [Hyphomicrobiaceae bacterium]
MATILQFRAFATTNRRGAMPPPVTAHRSAEIVFFPGVRITRWQEAEEAGLHTAGGPEGTGSGGRRNKR